MPSPNIDQRRYGVELRDGPCLVLPWHPATSGLLIESAMTRTWEKMHAEEGLYATVFHENPVMSFAQYMAFFSRPNVFPQLMVHVDAAGTIVDLAGLVWLCDYETLETHTRATGSFVWFKAYQKRMWTDRFARLVLRYWFARVEEGGMGVDLLIGMTPELNRAARIFTVRSGLRYVSRLPAYSVFQGQRCDALVALMDRQEYVKRYEVAEIETVEA